MLKKINISTKGQAEDIEITIQVNSTQQNMDAKEKMNNLNINLKELTYYLIQLFYQTGRRYSCTQTKLGKLLSILAFRYAHNGNILFEETIYKYPPNCGALIKDLTFVPREIYTRDINADDFDMSSPIDVAIDTSIDIQESYKMDFTLSNEVISEIETVFRLFGAYTPYKLGELLNPVVNKIKSDGNELNLEKLKELNITDFSTSEINAVIDYIF